MYIKSLSWLSFTKKYDNMHILQVDCGSTQYNYLITHNVSSDQSPITVNRTNVTLYGVQPGETYTVEIIPYVTSATMSYFVTATVSIKSPVCTIIGQRGNLFDTWISVYNHQVTYVCHCFIVESTSRIGFIASIGSMIVIIFVLCGYIAVCAATKLTSMPDHVKTCVNFLNYYHWLIN